MQQPQSEQPPSIVGFRDLVRIAGGGFSTVYTAHQEAIGRTVAVKVLHADNEDPEARQQFTDECELTGRLTGQPHIVTVFAAGTTVDGRFFIAMQYLRDGSLADRVSAGGPLPPEQVARIGVAVAGALEAAHSAGIVHGDIKPGNILVSEFGEPVLTDFGIASLIDRAGDGPAAGFTRAHAAPELLHGGPPSVRSDIYALGSTLYTLLTATSPAGALTGAAGGGAGGPDTLLGGLEQVLRRAIASDRDQRPASAAELGGELAALLPPGLAPVGLQPIAPVAQSRSATSTAGAGPGAIAGAAAHEATRLRPDRVVAPGQVNGGKSRRKLIVSAVATVAILILAATTYAVMGPDDSAVPVAVSTPVVTAASAGPTTTGTSNGPQATSAGPATTQARPGQPPTGNSTTRQPPSGPTPAASAPPRPTITQPAPPPPTVCTTSGCAGKAYFVANGEHLFVCDEKSDGYGVIAQYTRTDVPGQNNEAANRGGYGSTCVDHNMDMSEGTKITFRVCLVDTADRRFDCSGYLTPSA